MHLFCDSSTYVYAPFHQLPHSWNWITHREQPRHPSHSGCCRGSWWVSPSALIKRREYRASRQKRWESIMISASTNIYFLGMTWLKKNWIYVIAVEDWHLRICLNFCNNRVFFNLQGFTPLILAATAGHANVVASLLDANAEIEALSDRTKDTPLSLACSGGRLVCSLYC